MADYSEDFLEDFINDVIMETAKLLKKEDERIHIINKSGFERFEKTYELLKNVFKKQGVKIEYQIHEPFKSMGSISICGKEIIVPKTKEFFSAVQNTPNVDIYSTTDGKVIMSFSTDNLTTPIY